MRVLIDRTSFGRQIFSNSVSDSRYIRCVSAALLPMHLASNCLRKRANFSREHVFVTGANTPWQNNLLRAFYANCKRAGIEGAEANGSVDIHALRVSFTTLTLENGASPKAIQAILGHSTLALTMGVYAKATDRAKRDAVGALPFARTSAPDGVLPMQKKHGESTSRNLSLQVVAAQGS